MVRGDGSRILLPKSRRKPQPEPYERYFRVAPGETVLDVGACIGEFAIPAAKRAKEVVAVEAVPENRAWLRMNVSVNKLQNVCIVGKAAWNRGGSLRLYLSNENIGAHSLVIKKGRKSTEVKADTLDNIISELGIEKVDFVKMDVEGAELEALEGAEKVLNKARKIVVETHLRNGNATTPKVKQVLEARDFKVHVEAPSKICGMIYGRKK